MSVHRLNRNCGFTLIEVMISIFLTLLLIIGINQAFKIMSSTVGAGQAMGVSTRDSFSAQLVLQQEISQALSHSAETPFLIIDSQAQRAFRHKQDLEFDRDGDPMTIDLNNNNAEGEAPLRPDLPYSANQVRGERKWWFQQNDRIHRTDMLGFFTNGLYRRQTGNDGDALPDGFTAVDPRTPGNREAYGPATPSFAAQQSSQQAYVWFGHLWLPTAANPAAVPTTGWYVDTATPQMPSYPGEGTYATNPYNYLATDWIVGRMQILLTPGWKRPDVAMDVPLNWNDWHKMEPTSLRGTKTLGTDDNRPAPAPVDRAQTSGTTHGQLLTAIDRPPFVGPPLKRTQINNPQEFAAYLPLAHYQTMNRDKTGRIFTHPWSANTPADWSAASWDKAAEFQSVEAGRYDCAVGDFSTFKSILMQSIARANSYNYQNQAYNWRWWEPLSYRFRANPNIMKPMDAAGVAQAQPVLLRHCTQFLVEFAGDFVKQSNDVQVPRGSPQQYLNTDYGNVMDVYFDKKDPQPTDGIIDYYVLKGNVNDPKTWVRKIRWYGFPRDIDNDDRVLGYRESRTGEGAMTNNDIVDVVPVRDILLTGFTKTADPVTKKMRTWAGHGWDGSGIQNPAAVPPDPLPTFAGAPFEKDLEAFDNADGMHMGYLRSQGMAGVGGSTGDYATSVAQDSRYFCAFGPVGSEQNNSGGGRRAYAANITSPSSSNPVMPLVADDSLTRIKLLRITITLDDPNNRLPEAQTFEYVIALP